MTSPPEPTLEELGNVHFIGIGGAGMSGLARLLLDRGLRVSGSDIHDSARLRDLARVGATVYVGHSADRIGSPSHPADTVVATPIVPDDNVEIAEARRRGIRILSRAQALSIMMSGRRVIGVGGTHGKTTTTSMVTVALRRCGADPSFAIGGEVDDLGSNAGAGSSDIFVVEADESDGAFLLLDPVAVVVTNLEPDHLNYWKTYQALEAAFDRFVSLPARNDGFAVVCLDQPGSRALALRARERGDRVVTYGTDPESDYRVEIIGSRRAGYRFNVARGGEEVGIVTLSVPGRHNALNATAALVTCVQMGFDAALAQRGLDEFTGAQRRFELRGEARGVRVYDDYAHHPTELRATLTAAREFVGEGRVVVAFQPHSYYRTAMFTKELGEALGLADDVIVLDVYAPGDEESIPGAGGEDVAADVPLPSGRVVYEPSRSLAVDRLAGRARPGDIVMTLGAGDVSLLGPEVLERIEGSQAARTRTVGSS